MTQKIIGRLNFPLQQITFDEQGSKDSPAESDVQLLRTGTFYHEKYGEIKITPTVLSEMVGNWQSRVRKIDLAIDYKHESEDIAAGWIKKVFLGEDKNSLWATVSWTPRGRKVLSDKEFRYLSADFAFNYQDNETLQKYGPTLFGAGLTNRPVIKSMEPAVELTEVTHQEGKEKMKDEKPGLESKVAKLEEQMAELQKAKPAEEKVEPKDAKAPKAAEVDSDSLLQAIKDLGDRVAALEKGEEGEDDMAEKEKAQMAEKKKTFDVLLSEGKACEAQRKPYMSGDMVKFAELSKGVKLSSVGHGNGAVDETEEAAASNAQDQVMKLAEKKMEEKKAKTIGEAIRLVFSEKPELQKEYEKETA